MDSNKDFASAEIIALENAALDRWGQGDPQGYLELDAEEVTYFDPMIESRIDGLEAMRAHLLPITGKFKIERHEMIKPKVQLHGDAAVLTSNLIDYGTQPGGTETVVLRWNSTEVYARIGGAWRIVHSHWSYVKGEATAGSQQ